MLAISFGFVSGDKDKVARELVMLRRTLLLLRGGHGDDAAVVGDGNVVLSCSARGPGAYGR